VTFNATTTAHISLGTPDDASRAKLARLIGGIAENTEQFFESDLPRRESYCYSCVSSLLAILEATDVLDANGPITALGSLQRANHCARLVATGQLLVGSRLRFSKYRTASQSRRFAPFLKIMPRKLKMHTILEQDTEYLIY